MENTSPLLFDNSEQKYFLAIGTKAVGPLTAQEVYEKIQRGEVGLLHFFWRKGAPEWKRLMEDKTFAVLVPKKPPANGIKTLRARIGDLTQESSSEIAAGAESAPSRPYYLYFNNTQFGPLSSEEMARALKTQNISRHAYAWMAGWPTWKRLSTLPEFAAHLEPKIAMEPKKTKPKAGKDRGDKRNAPRRPLVARLFLHNNQDVIIAVCRDISVGGMQVLTDRVPGPVGTRVRLNVSPGDPGQVKGFVAEGEIVRVLEDGRGFSFRFLKVSDEAKDAIERYISEPL